MKEYLLKVPNGKLLRLLIEIKNKKIESIKITGDFFAYPEESISFLESQLLGKKQEEIPSCIDKFLSENKIEILGFSKENLEELIIRSFKDDLETNNR